VADVNTAQLHLFAEPRDGDYQRGDVARSGATVPLDRLGVHGVLLVADLFGAVVDT
jgi:hypothetical protein